MNQKDRRTYSLLSQRQQARIEARHMRKIYKALRITVDDFLADAKQRGLTAATSTLYTVIGNQPLAEQLQALHEEAGLFFGRKAYREIQSSVKPKAKQRLMHADLWRKMIQEAAEKPEVGQLYAKGYLQEKTGFGFNLQWAADIISYFTNDLFALVSQITSTTRNQILDVLARAQTEGQSFEWIENQLTSPDLLAWRARLIARTETAKGAFVGRKLANRDTEWETEKEWISAHDKRTRHGHLKVDGEVIDTDARFQVQYPKGTDMMEGPGDPSANIANLANCRCSQAHVAKRDANGRLIRKQEQLTQTI